MASSTSTSTANPELDSTCFKSKKVVGIDLECDNQNNVWVLDEDSIDLDRNICGTTEYWKFYKKRISPSMIQSSHIPEQKPIEDAKLLAAQQAQIDYIYTHLINDSVLSHNAYVTPNYWELYERCISPNQVNKIAYDLTRTGGISANEARQLCVDQTGTKNRQKHIKKKGQNCIPIPVEDSSGIKIRWVTLSKQKPPEQSNKKKSTAIVEVAVLIFLLLCLNGVFFWSFIFKLLTH